MIRKTAIGILVGLFALSPSAWAAGKFEIDGTVLIYDTYAAEKEENREITWDDADEIERLLLANEGVEVLELTSSGGLVEAAQEIADTVIDFELDTHVVGECSSACVTIFLGGVNRTLQRGSKLGFHKSSWDAASLRDYYEDGKETEGWLSPFDFAEWLYEDTQRVILDDMLYLLERGVDPAFAIKTLQADTDDMWHPRRAELIDAGILTDG